MADAFQPLYLPQAAEAPKLDPSFSEVMSSAFGLENDVANLLDYMSRPTFEPDLSFDFQKEMSAQQVPDDWMSMLATTKSKGEFDFTLGKIQKEYKDKSVLAAAGWGGTVAAMSAGMLSPTVLIPFTGQARGGMAFAQMLGLAAVGAGAQNGALFLNQATRTEAELYSGVAMDTLLMGLMGGAYFGLTKAGRAQLAGDVSFNNNRLTAPTGPLDVPNGSAATVRLEAPAAREVKREARELGIRDPKEIADMLDEAEVADEYIPLKDRALQLSPVRRVSAKSDAEAMTHGRNYLEVDVSDGVTARFTKVPAGSGGKWFQDGEYGISLHAADGKEINVPQAKVTSHQLAGATGKYKEAELREALDKGELDDHLYSMLEQAEEPGMARSTVEEAIPNSSARDAQAAGAAPTRSRNTLGAERAPSRARQTAMNTLGRLSPAYRMLTQPFFPSLRDAAAKLDVAGIRQAGLDSAQPSASGGQIISRIAGYDYHIVAFADKLDQNYVRYLYGNTKQKLDSPAIAQIKSMMGQMPGGKLNWAQYKAAVFDALNTGDIPGDLADSVQAFSDFFKAYTARQSQYLDEMTKAGLEVEPLFKELETDDLGEGIVNYAHHIFSKKELMEKSSEFLDDFTKYNEEVLQNAFARARKRYEKRKRSLEFEQEIADLSPEDISARLGDVEADIEFLDELPELLDANARRLAITKQAREEGWPKEKLKEQLKTLQENLPEAVKALQQERKGLLATARAFKKFGGDSAAKTAKLREDIDALDKLIDDMFRSELPGIEKVDLAVGKLQKQSDAALSGVQKSMKKVVKELQAKQVKMAKLLNSKRMNTTSRAKVQENIDRLKAKYDGLAQMLDDVMGQQIARDDRLRGLFYVRESLINDATELVQRRAVRKAELEEKVEEVAAKVLLPEDRARMKAQVGEELWALDSDFQQLWSSRGERSGDPTTTTTPDFKDQSRKLAQLLHQKLMHTEVELSPTYRALRQDARGAELLRVMKIPYAIKQKWLEKDVEIITRAYDRVMAADLEIWRAFDGSVNAKSLLGEMQDEATEHLTRIGTAKYVKLPKGWVDKSAAYSKQIKDGLEGVGQALEFLSASNFSDAAKPGFVEISPELRNQLNQTIHDAVKASTRDLDVAIQRLRATRTTPQDSGSILWRTGKAVKSLNVLTMMGGVVPSSISDVARPMIRYGVSKTIGRGWMPFINNISAKGKSFRMISKEVNRRIGVNLEPMLHSRAQGVFDLAQDSIDRTKLERAITFGANKMGLVAMYDYWTAGMKTIAANVFHATMAEYVPAVAKAYRDGVEPTGDVLAMRSFLRGNGLTDLDIHRIALQMERPGGVEKFSNGGVLPNIGAWDDMAAYQAYQAATIKQVNEVIVTPGLEKPNWVDENMGFSLIAQFKSFTFGANSRMAMSTLQGNDPYVMQGLTFALAFGALSYYTYAIAAGGKTLEEANEMNADQWLWEAVKRSGFLGVLSLGVDALDKVPAMNGEAPNIFTKPGGLLGTFLGPTYSQFEKLATVITQSGTEDAKQQARNLRMLRQVFVPFQNHFLFRQLFDRVGEAMAGK